MAALAAATVVAARAAIALAGVHDCLDLCVANPTQFAAANDFLKLKEFLMVQPTSAIDLYARYTIKARPKRTTSDMPA